MTALEVVDDPIGNYPHRDWEDLTARSGLGREGPLDAQRQLHGSCSWQVYTRNGQVWREEQAGD